MHRLPEISPTSCDERFECNEVQQPDWPKHRAKCAVQITQLVTVNQNAPFATGGSYAFTDILLSRSPDGVHFSPAIQVNSDKQPARGRIGHDHFQPALAVDPFGKVGVCWYDRRGDPANFRIERFCATSKNAGRNWHDFRVKGTTSSPIHRLDLLVNPAYMGDYDGLTSDFSGKTAGFLGAFEIMSSGMNPDVNAFKFQ